MRYDEAKVPTFTFTRYQGWCSPQSEYALYPGEFSYKYPVAGEQNSRVSVHSYDVDTRKIKEIALKDGGIEYIPRIAFGGDNAERLMIVTLNRAQNRMELYSANPKSTVSKSVLVEEAKAWLNPATYEEIAFENDGFVVQSERTGWNNLYKYSYAGQQLRAITSGTADVTAYYGTDALGNSYYQAVPGDDVTAAVNRVFDLRPAAIIDTFDLRRPIYRQIAAYGHVGRTDIDLPWERVDKVEELRAALNM